MFTSPGIQLFQEIGTMYVQVHFGKQDIYKMHSDKDFGAQKLTKCQISQKYNWLHCVLVKGDMYTYL